MLKIKLPETPEQWLAIEEGFRKKFPRCVGAIVIKCPVYSGSEYYNYKGSYSIVLMALVASDYHFIFADIGGQGRISDGGIFQNCLLWQKIYTNALNLPPDVPLPSREKNIPYVFLGDGAFALHRNVMKPFPGNHDMGTNERTFNYRLSSSRVIVENTFGVLTSVFRVFKKPIEIDVSKVPMITLSCILLHNFLRKSPHSRNLYTPPGTFDTIENGVFIEGSWRQHNTGLSALRTIPPVSRRASTIALQVRSEFAAYFNNVNL
ncbi:hypothetical protein NQ314_005725 [Rhamnusium bicolor]|uniref:DDE Tnp4 domain-containing protein n=1 Tax=Rhamnusium bicolor TaxID=1586634 RepID=A0AAV8ZGQ6_9CUCU|nr:hypothetical protein NQ314_005725 [Rhamnusium bicolor]